MKKILDFKPSKTDKFYHGCLPKCFENILCHFGIKEINSTLIEALSGCYNLCYSRPEDQCEKEPVDFSILPNSDYAQTLRNLGIKSVFVAEEDQECQWAKVKDLIKRNYPVLVYTNTYYIEYCGDYLKNPGGFFHLHHILICIGYDEETGLLHVFDPAIDNYQGTLTLENFKKAWNYSQGIINPVPNGFLYLDILGWQEVPGEKLWQVALKANSPALTGKMVKRDLVTRFYGLPLQQQLLADFEECFIKRKMHFENESFLWSLLYSKKKLKDFFELGLTYGFPVQGIIKVLEQNIEQWNLIVMATTKANVTGKEAAWRQILELLRKANELEMELIAKNQLFEENEGR